MKLSVSSLTEKRLVSAGGGTLCEGGAGRHREAAGGALQGAQGQDTGSRPDCAPQVRASLLLPECRSAAALSQSISAALICRSLLLLGSTCAVHLKLQAVGL